jgi:hypothetical protein
MMKHRVSDLESALLDAAVAKALGEPERDFAGFSQYWDIGGPIIERERIWLAYESDNGEGGSDWVATIGADFASHLHETGPTPLIAAMRAYVASKFGEEVELP